MYINESRFILNRNKAAIPYISRKRASFANFAKTENVRYACVRELASLNLTEIGGLHLTQTQMPVRASPYVHQQAAYEFCYRLFTEDASPGAALLMEMGTGKTLTTIAIAGAL